MSCSQVLLSRSAFLHNVGVIKSIIGNKKIIFPVKSNAYGHGLKEMVSMARSHVDCFMVATLNEAIALRKWDDKTPVFIDVPLVEKDAIKEAITRNFSINLATSHQFGLMESMDSVMRKKIKVHIEFDTGMNRTGFKREEVESLNDFMKKHREIEVESVFTHYATGIDNEKEIGKQYEIFSGILDRLQFNYKHVHSENSAVILTKNLKHMDFARPGITLYGLKPSSGYTINLKRVLSWKSRIVDLKYLKPGDGVSYGYTFTARRKMKIATVPIGYGDGYPRSLSNRASVLVHEKRVKIIGTICMNHLMVDISDLEGVKVGDEVVLIGRQGEDEITACELAVMAKTINYEVVTRISPLLSRVIEQ